MHVLDAETGWAVGIRHLSEGSEAEDLEQAAGLFLSTTDGGKTWCKERIPQTRGILGLAIVGETGLVATGDATVLRFSIAP